MRTFFAVIFVVFFVAVFAQNPNPAPAPEAAGQFHQYPSNNYNQGGYNNQYGTTRGYGTTSGYYDANGRFYNSATSSGLPIAALLSACAYYVFAH